jgi:hypothetical protein
MAAPDVPISHTLQGIIGDLRDCEMVSGHHRNGRIDASVGVGIRTKPQLFKFLRSCQMAAKILFLVAAGV